MTYMIPTRRVKRNTPVRYTGFNSLFDDFFSDMWTPALSNGDSFKMDVKNTEDAYLVEADMPGVNKDEISLELEENVLTIQVKREEATEETEANYVHRERKVSSMSRSIRLRDVNADEIDAKLENGVLTVTLPKTDKSERVKQISVN